jgi:hypothetical protein
MESAPPWRHRWPFTLRAWSSLTYSMTELVESADELHLTFTLKLKTLEASKGAVAKK